MPVVVYLAVANNGQIYLSKNEGQSFDSNVAVKGNLEGAMKNIQATLHYNGLLHHVVNTMSILLYAFLILLSFTSRK